MRATFTLDGFVIAFAPSGSVLTSFRQRLALRASTLARTVRVGDFDQFFQNPLRRSVAHTAMDIRVSFPGGKRVDAQLGAHVVHTDQPTSAGGADSAPAPFDLFLASLATCAGIYVLGFCQARGLSTEGIEIVQRQEHDADHRLTKVALEVILPASFPEKYRASVVRAAEGCKVKKTLLAPPEVSAFATIKAEERVALTS